MAEGGERQWEVMNVLSRHKELRLKINSLNYLRRKKKDACEWNRNLQKEMPLRIDTDKGEKDMRELKREYWSNEIKTKSGKTTIDRREIAALVKNTPPQGIILDIHMKSSTIFTTLPMTNEEYDEVIQDLQIRKPPVFDDFASYVKTA